MRDGIGLQNRRFRSALSLIVAALLIGSISYLGVRTFKESQAASGPTIYASPSSGTVQQGATLSVTIREDSGSEALNSVQASMNYDSGTLQFVSLTEGGAFPVVAANSTATAGVIRVGRANSDTNVSGDNPIVTVNFRVIGASGTGSVDFDKAFSFLVRGSDSKDVLQNVSGGSYNVSGGSSNNSNGSRPILYINPAGGSFNAGSTVAATVRLNAYDTEVTTVEAAVGYPANLLQYTGVSEGGVFTTQQRTNASNGVVDIIRGLPGGSGGVTGDKAVVTINFKVLATGSAPLTINGPSAVYDSSGSGHNILNAGGSSGASYTLASSGGTGPAPTPSPSPSPSPVTGSTSTGAKTTSVTTPAQALTIGAKSGNGHISLTTGDDGAPLAELGGEVELAPIIDQSVFAENPGDGISKVEYYLDGKLISTQKQAPYTYKFDTLTMRNGTYTMVVKTYFKSGNVDTRTDKLLVNNKVNLAYVVRNYMPNIIVTFLMLLLLTAVVWKLVIPRFNAAHAFAGGTDHDALYGLSPDYEHGMSPGPVADEPTVIMPFGSAAPSDQAVDVPAEVKEAVQSTAALTTDALPMAAAAPMRPASAPDTTVPPAPVAEPQKPAVSSPAAEMAQEPRLNPAANVNEPLQKPLAVPPAYSTAPASSAHNDGTSGQSFNSKYVNSAPRPDYTTTSAQNPSVNQAPVSKPILVKVLDEPATPVSGSAPAAPPTPPATPASPADITSPQ